jgi:amidohydrolase
MELLNAGQIKDIIALRKWLHRNPELSGNEKNTSRKLEEFLLKTNPDKLIPGIGGYGIAAVYHFSDDGPTIMLRADMDALPMEEVNTFSHKSETPAVSHKCGHDGHSSILVGMAMALRNKPLSSGRVVLLFQPEEETGKGAQKVIADEAFRMIIPDAVIALHNLPGYNTSSVIVKEGTFAAASEGIIVKWKGKAAHAAHPEQGISPASAIAEAIVHLTHLPKSRQELFKDFTQITIIHASFGEITFGMAPSEGILMATLRAFEQDDMTRLKKQAEILLKNIAEENKLQIDISYTEQFPATINHAPIVKLIMEVCDDLGEEITVTETPFRWSEDFGHFSQRYPSVLFGIGSGKDTPDLHQYDYDFPDEIIPGAVHLFYQITQRLLKKNNL